MCAVAVKVKRKRIPSNKEVRRSGSSINSG
jgi:hypothetical protein